MRQWLFLTFLLQLHVLRGPLTNVENSLSYISSGFADHLNCTLTRLNRVTESQAKEELERRDPSGSGVISEQALGKVLAKLGADLAGSDLGRIMHRFDVHEVIKRTIAHEFSSTC